MDRLLQQEDSCYGVRKFSLPPSSDIAIVVLAILAILINGFALISVLRNYRRLRQRIYVFVISLGVADLLSGIIFLADSAIRIASPTNDNGMLQNLFIYQREDDSGRKIIILNEDEKFFVTKEILEGLKVGCVVLSVLNTALVTFALYKRTTSMGRHNEDMRNFDGAFGPDGHPFLPAFDTMMRVLSIGSPVVANGMNKNMGKNSHAFHNDGKIRRTSTASHASYSSMQPEEPGSGTRKPQVIKLSTENGSRKPAKSNRSSSLSWFMHSGRRLSQAVRSRSASGTQSYVGRHSNSVMSKGATRCTLFMVWLIFVVTCVITPILHRTGNESVFCSTTCRAMSIRERIPASEEAAELNGAILNSTRISNGPENFLNSRVQGTARNPAGCAPNGYSEIFPNVSRTRAASSTGERPHPPCSACSSAFFPLSKSHLVFVVLIIVITWLWLITSSARLLYLRKHSNNVFVRCSALWRFMFLTALFFFVTLLPLVIWMILDFRTGSSAIKSPLWYGQPYRMTNTADNVSNITNSAVLRADFISDTSYLRPVVGAISSCLLLLHFAVTPSLYLIRLLGFRRIISAI